MNSSPCAENDETDELEKINPRRILDDWPIERFCVTFGKSGIEVNNGKVSSADSRRAGVETGNDSNDSAIAQIDANNQSFGADSIVTSANVFPTKPFPIEPQSFKSTKYNQMALVRTRSLPPSASFARAISMSYMTDDINKPQSSLSSDDKITEPFGTDGRRGDDLDALFRTMHSAGIDPNRKQSLDDLKVALPLNRERISGNRLKLGRFSPYIRNFSMGRLQRTLRLAAATNNVDLARNVLQRGISPNSSDPQGRTPLHFAAGRGYTEIVDLLLKYGANANCKDAIGNTPLHLAAVTSKIAVVTLLLEAGTDPQSPDYHGYSPLQLAKSKLRLMQDSRGDDVNIAKSEVQELVNMLTAFLKNREGFGDQVEELSSFCSRLTLSNTSDEVKNEVQNLLTNIDNIRLNS